MAIIRISRNSLPTLFLLVALHTTCSAQTANKISGDWNGTIEVPLGEDYLGEFHFAQHGLILDGYTNQKSISGKDSVKLKLSGSVKGNTVKFKSTEIIYKTRLICLSTTELVYKREGDRETLTGKWKGDWSLNTCPPGASGKVELVKLNPIAALSDKQEIAPVSIHPEDDSGVALANELGKRKYYALIIGINTYADPAIEDLDNPVPDATELQRVLLSHYMFAKENVIFLTNPTRSTIIESFDALSEKITNRDHLLIFYAGHGIWDERLNQGFWLPTDARMNSKAQWLSNSTIRDYIGGIKSKHTLLITDACFSGSIFKERGVTFNDGKALLEMYKLPSRKAMTSGALKTVPDKSVFITYLTKNLITNERPLLSAEELFRTFKIAVINNSVNGQVPQYGPIGQAGDEGGDFIFLKRN